MKHKDLWTVVHRDSKTPVVPYDSNPGSTDEGMLVYRSQEAARSAALHQRKMYSLVCDACRLDRAELG